MNVHVSYQAGKTPEIEKEFTQQIAKLQRRLQVFRPELLHLHARVDHNSARQGLLVQLNLRMPSGQLACEETGGDGVAVTKAAFAELLKQLTRHKELLRNERGWYRRRGGREMPGVPFEETFASVTADGKAPRAGNGVELETYVNVNLARLQRFIEREVQYRESTGDIPANQASPEEVLDETIADALAHIDEKPDELKLEAWLVRLALRAMRRVAAGNQGDGAVVRLEQSAEPQNVSGTDDGMLQFHMPDDSLHTEDVIPDPGGWTPEQMAIHDEMVAQLQLALREGPAHEREAFILFAIEGFTVEEIAHITERGPEDVSRAVRNARQRVQHRLPQDNDWKRHVLERTKSA